MKKLFTVLAVLACTAACSKVPAGFVGVKVHTMGSEKGVDQEVVGVGYYWLPPTVDLYTFPTFQQNYVWTASAHEGTEHDESITFQDMDSLSINTDVGISYTVDATKVATLFQTYRKGIAEITDTILRNMVRDGFSRVGGTMKVEEIMGLKKSELFQKVTDRVNSQIGPVGIHVNLYSVGAMRPPEGVRDAINAKIQATQKALQLDNEVAQATAQANKAIAIANGEKQANELKTKSITPALLQYMAIEKWDGKLPQVTGQGGTPFINLKHE